MVTVKRQKKQHYLDGMSHRLSTSIVLAKIAFFGPAELKQALFDQSFIFSVKI